MVSGRIALLLRCALSRCCSKQRLASFYSFPVTFSLSISLDSQWCSHRVVGTHDKSLEDVSKLNKATYFRVYNIWHRTFWCILLLKTFGAIVWWRIFWRPQVPLNLCKRLTCLALSHGMLIKLISYSEVLKADILESSANFKYTEK